MDRPRVSVVIVSFGRPEALARCLTGVAQLDYGPFEVVVVCDTDGLEAVEPLPFSDALRIVSFSEPNISRARNLGVEAAGGEILAFIDDDAVPEPTWLTFLSRPFMQSADAAVGYVRGRNGISFQSRADAINVLGQTVSAHPVAGDIVPQCPDGAVPKLIGTNMAVRRETLCRLGGFDETFRFYLEDSDLSLRLATAGSKVASVPTAEVHHGFAASSRRTWARTPRTLSDIGRSLATFLRKHASTRDIATAQYAARAEQRRRLLRHMVAGNLEPGGVPRLLSTFDAGFEDGMANPFAPPAKIGAPPSFTRFPDRFRSTGHKLLSGSFRHRSQLRAAAARNVRAGERTTLLLLSPTTLFHRVRFAREGYWEQSGGVFGRSERFQPVFRAVSLADRIREEALRVAKVRGIEETSALEELPRKP